MGLDEKTKSTVTLVSNDQEIFVVERTVAAQSELVKTMMEGGVLLYVYVYLVGCVMMAHW